jgi:hypothetical protein
LSQAFAFSDSLRIGSGFSQALRSFSRCGYEVHEQILSMSINLLIKCFLR